MYIERICCSQERIQAAFTAYIHQYLPIAYTPLADKVFPLAMVPVIFAIYWPCNSEILHLKQYIVV